MGLDMTLYVQEDTDFAPQTGPIEVEDYDAFYEGLSEVAYWRKVNSVHAWFVREAQGGVDECQPHFVTRQQVIDLRDTAQRVYDTFTTVEEEKTDVSPFTGKPFTYNEITVVDYDHDIVRDLLPPQSGFFFGPAEVDDWYVEGLKQTITDLTKVLDEQPEDAIFVYWSSW